MRKLSVRLTAILITAVLLITVISVFAYDAELNGWAYEAIEFTDVTEPLAEVKIALIDTGVSTKRINPELVIQGKNYVFEGADTEDLNGHGTRVASLILGYEDERGVLQPLAASVKIVPLVYYSRYPSGVPKNGGVEAICQAVYDAVDLYGCKVINISSGVIVQDDRLAAAVLYAEKNNVIVVSAAGNDNLRAPERQYYPAAYDTVIGVGAVNQQLEAATFSQRNGVTVYAPGENISAVSIKNGRVFETVSGTSYATAFVSALAANLLGKYPEMTPADFREVLQTSSQKSELFENEDNSVRLINFENAFKHYEELLKTRKEKINNG